MPDSSNEQFLNRGLLGGAAAVGAVVAVGVRSNKLNKIAETEQFQVNERVDLARRERRMTPRQRARHEQVKEVPSEQASKQRDWQIKQLDENPDEFRKQIKKRRLADRAARASKLTKGLTNKMGALGATAGMADAVGSASRIEKEGGSFEARFGKFAEELLGLPPGATQRPLTAAEKKAQLST